MTPVDDAFGFRISSFLRAWVFRHSSFLFLSSLLFLALSVPADTITMTNGEVMEGVIEQEGDNSLVLNIGMGAITLRKAKIASIARDDDAANREREEDWKTTYIKFEALPPVLQKLSTQFDSVAGHRAKALKAAKNLPILTKRQEPQEKRWAAERKRHSAMTQRLASISPRRNAKAYNALVEENNDLVAEVNRLQGWIERDKVMRRTHRGSIVAYSQALSRLESDFKSAAEEVAARPGEGSEIAAAWLVQAAGRLTQYQNDFQRMAIPVSPRPGQGTIVSVSINGADPASFILDTGASVVTVSETLARRLNLRFNREAPRRLSMADGSEVDGYPVILSSVAVGEAKAEQIEAVVISNPPADGVDGLLGMTFLRHFEMSFDASTANLVLTRLK